MNFPLFRRPATVAFLDDDPDYLEMLALVMPTYWNVKLFLRPSECIEVLQQEPPFWEADAWTQQQLVDGWRAGKPLIQQILHYWSRSTERFALTKVCVCDYSMPAMNGLQALAELADWPGSRVLLTGQADEQIAVAAFNRGLIDQFIPKQSQDISRRLTESIQNLLDSPHPRHAQTWRTTLTPQQNAALRSASLDGSLTALAERNWVEYIVIGQPFGVLGLSASGDASWLQLETKDGLAALAELAEVEGVAESDLTRIRAGELLADVELRQALGRAGPVAMAQAIPLGRSGALLGSIFKVPPSFAPEVSNSYREWLARQPVRDVSH